MDDISKGNDSAELQEKKPILYYYQEHNEKAKNEILTFLKNVSRPDITVLYIRYIFPVLYFRDRSMMLSI